MLIQIGPRKKTYIKEWFAFYARKKSYLENILMYSSGVRFEFPPGNGLFQVQYVENLGFEDLKFAPILGSVITLVLKFLSFW